MSNAIALNKGDDDRGHYISVQSAFMDEHAFCVIGAEEKMKDNQDLFDGLYNLVEG